MKLRKAPSRDLYWVLAADGKKYFRDPIPLSAARAYMAKKSPKKSRNRSPRKSRISGGVAALDVLTGVGLTGAAGYVAFGAGRRLRDEFSAKDLAHKARWVQEDRAEIEAYKNAVEDKARTERNSVTIKQEQEKRKAARAVPSSLRSLLQRADADYAAAKRDAGNREVQKNYQKSALAKLRFLFGTSGVKRKAQFVHSILESKLDFSSPNEKPSELTDRFVAPVVSLELDKKEEEWAFVRGIRSVVPFLASAKDSVLLPQYLSLCKFTKEGDKYECKTTTGETPLQLADTLHDELYMSEDQVQERIDKIELWQSDTSRNTAYDDIFEAVLNWYKLAFQQFVRSP